MHTLCSIRVGRAAHNHLGSSSVHHVTISDLLYIIVNTTRAVHHTCSHILRPVQHLQYITRAHIYYGQYNTCSTSHVLTYITASTTPTVHHTCPTNILRPVQHLQYITHAQQIYYCQCREFLKFTRFIDKTVDISLRTNSKLPAQ